MTENPKDILAALAKLHAKGITPEQQKRREEVAERTERFAHMTGKPKDGVTWGKQQKGSKGA